MRKSRGYLGPSVFILIESPIKIVIFPEKFDDLDDISTISVFIFLYKILLLPVLLAASPIPFHS